MALSTDVSMPSMGGGSGLYGHYKHVAAIYIAGVIGGLALFAVNIDWRCHSILGDVVKLVHSCLHIGNDKESLLRGEVDLAVSRLPLGVNIA